MAGELHAAEPGGPIYRIAQALELLAEAAPDVLAEINEEMSEYFHEGGYRSRSEFSEAATRAKCSACGRTLLLAERSGPGRLAVTYLTGGLDDDDDRKTPSWGYRSVALDNVGGGAVAVKCPRHEGQWVALKDVVAAVANKTTLRIKLIPHTVED